MFFVVLMIFIIVMVIWGLILWGAVTAGNVNKLAFLAVLLLGIIVFLFGSGTITFDRPPPVR